jgi:hypothetical protein
MAPVLLLELPTVAIIATGLPSIMLGPEYNKALRISPLFLNARISISSFASVKTPATTAGAFRSVPA